jgi:hypothetical protein
MAGAQSLALGTRMVLPAWCFSLQSCTSGRMRSLKARIRLAQCLRRGRVLSGVRPGLWSFPEYALAMQPMRRSKWQVYVSPVLLAAHFCL